MGLFASVKIFRRRACVGLVLVTYRLDGWGQGCRGSRRMCGGSGVEVGDGESAEHTKTMIITLSSGASKN